MRPLNDNIMLAKEIEMDLHYEELINIDEMDPYDRNQCAYLASAIEANIIQKILSQSLSACQDCINVFSENAKTFNSFVAKKNRTKTCAQPCSSTMNVVVASCSLLIHLESFGYAEFNSTAKTIFNNLNIDELYYSSDFSTHQIQGIEVYSSTHKEQFVSNIILEYMHMKSRKIGNKITTEEHKGNFIRKKLTRSVIDAHQ